MYVSSQNLELVEVRKSLEFAEIRDDCRMLRWSSSSFARVCQRVSQNLPFSGAERDGWCWRCHLRSIYLPDLECWSSWRLGCEGQDAS